jgi:hypothetical protein
MEDLAAPRLLYSIISKKTTTYVQIAADGEIIADAAHVGQQKASWRRFLPARCFQTEGSRGARGA